MLFFSLFYGCNYDYCILLWLSLPYQTNRVYFLIRLFSSSLILFFLYFVYYILLNCSHNSIFILVRILVPCLNSIANKCIVFRFRCTVVLMDNRIQSASVSLSLFPHTFRFICTFMGYIMDANRRERYRKNNFTGTFFSVQQFGERKKSHIIFVVSLLQKKNNNSFDVFLEIMKKKITTEWIENKAQR